MDDYYCCFQICIILNYSAISSLLNTNLHRCPFISSGYVYESGMAESKYLIIFRAFDIFDIYGPSESL